MSTTDQFFNFARERHGIYLKRKAGKQRPWTRDRILHEYKFTNVFRELDKTTEWFKFNVRDPMRGDPEVLLATVIFRWFNRISSGEAMFCQRLITRETAFEHFLKNGDVGVFKAALKAYCGDHGPYVTGAYMIKSPTGMEKVDGILELIRKFNEEFTWRDVAQYYMLWPKKQSLELIWQWLKDADHLGPFLAYEVVTDLRHTEIMENAHDIMTWGNPGPGCARGVSRIHNMGIRSTKKGNLRPCTPSPAKIHDTMEDLLRRSKFPDYWPRQWPKWEMREVEHTLCEWDKYERIRNGQGKVKGRYHACEQ